MQRFVIYIVELLFYSCYFEIGYKQAQNSTSENEKKMLYEVMWFVNKNEV